LFGCLIVLKHLLQALSESFDFARTAIRLDWTSS
jgi:hypothetical protein